MEKQEKLQATITVSFDFEDAPITLEELDILNSNLRSIILEMNKQEMQEDEE